MAIADLELQRQERKNRRRIKAAAAVAMLWPGRVHHAPVAHAFAFSRAEARKAGAKIARRQLRKEMRDAEHGPHATDHVRSLEATRSYVRADEDARAHTLERHVVTETATAFNEGIVEEGKRIAEEHDLELEQVWSAENDARTCVVCAALDGTVVGLAEEFEGGGPGEVHPNCRCTISLRVKSE